jgi:hypothetical protein
VVLLPGLTAGLALCDVGCGADEEGDVKGRLAITCQASHNANSSYGRPVKGLELLLW